MSTIFSAHYDGHVIVPDEPVALPIGKTLQVRVEPAAGHGGQFADLTEFAADLPDSPGNLSVHYGHYFHGLS